ncbi:MAG: RNA 2',3'-cyclic phosphodiesterase [Burkholderiaceae bacterium]
MTSCHSLYALMSRRTAPTEQARVAGTAESPAPTARLFIAVWPDAALRARLAGFRDHWRWPPGARLVADANLHVTLHFIGSFARDRIAALGERLAQVEIQPFGLQAESASIWRGGIAVLTLHGDVTGALDALHVMIGCALREFGIPLDPRPFAPHVTLARTASHAQPPNALPKLDCARAASR